MYSCYICLIQDMFAFRKSEEICKSENNFSQKHKKGRFLELHGAT